MDGFKQVLLPSIHTNMLFPYWIVFTPSPHPSHFLFQASPPPSPTMFLTSSSPHCLKLSGAHKNTYAYIHAQMHTRCHIARSLQYLFIFSILAVAPLLYFLLLSCPNFLSPLMFSPLPSPPPILLPLRLSCAMVND